MFLCTASFESFTPCNLKKIFVNLRVGPNFPDPENLLSYLMGWNGQIEVARRSLKSEEGAMKE